MPGKFDSQRDELFYVMTLDGWANESSGNVECPTGFFARISNEPREVAEIRDAFPTETKGLSNADIVGHFLCQENEQGFWYVREFDNPRELLTTYQALEAEYAEWLD
ncbi:hypothetical protein PP460_gp012 [Streptomyces phage Muntaha]|uniref:Uncharacterized protein n=1 Tax=Streptomyces phage Muntaha TaxID=2713269 RepID=A0A6G8R2Z0_9CAUD|nr:hypothetical protein PP460_gp004 [Streptomyces phage Muntaha]YP_010652546.1 hypothetical protein PP460_gp012 [Streptomyces phage Muntaha]QIN94564.1 hypothetical protein SEA_MUNTAHA_4 [Streptomyces phage Muntaha]QIN94790.1 hypothetical protein SEA_MUNTAHA_267 [Streptomyces phage Muntaha]